MINPNLKVFIENMKAKYLSDETLRSLTNSYVTSTGAQHKNLGKRLDNVNKQPGGKTRANQKVAVRNLIASPGPDKTRRITEAEEFRKMLSDIHKVANRLKGVGNRNIFSYLVELDSLLKKGDKVLNVVSESIKNT